MKDNTKQQCEFIRYQAKQKFDKVRSTWCDLLRWGAPYKASWILSQTPGERKNQHIVDPTHILALRSYTAGFLEGNTSTTRPWIRIGVKDSDKNDNDVNKAWLQHYTQRVLSTMSNSNFYNAAGIFYNDFGVVNTGSHYFEELSNNSIHVHTLIPGSYYVLNDAYGEAAFLVREFAMNVKSLVDTYGKNKDGVADWSNFSSAVKTLYKDGNYGEMIDVVHIVKENTDFDANNPYDPDNRKWLELTYELGGNGGHFYQVGNEYGNGIHPEEDQVFLRRFTGKRKPFVVGKSTPDFEYGEKGPTLDSLGLIKSLNKKGISKDQALEHMLKPALQGPASLRKNYISHAPNTFVPIDARSAGRNQKLEPIFNINPAFGELIQDVGDLRRMVDELYYADFLLFLSKNPKTRTATEAAAVVEEQQRVIGPNLQSLNTTYNVPVTEYFMDWTLFNDPYLDPIPEGLRGQALKPEFISVFAQAQKAADLPSIDRYMQAMMNLGQIYPKALDKVNSDKYADLLEDRLYLPSGLNNPQSKVDNMREQAQREAQRQQALTETAPAVAKAAKDMSAANSQQQQTN